MEFEPLSVNFSFLLLFRFPFSRSIWSEFRFYELMSLQWENFSEWSCGRLVQEGGGLGDSEAEEPRGGCWWCLHCFGAALVTFFFQKVYCWCDEHLKKKKNYGIKLINILEAYFYLISFFFCLKYAKDAHGTRHRLYTPRFWDGRSFCCPILVLISCSNILYVNVKLGTGCFCAEVEPISTYLDFGEREFLVADERGYEYLLYKMAEDFLFTSEGKILDSRLKLNKVRKKRENIFVFLLKKLTFS